MTTTAVPTVVLDIPMPVVGKRIGFIYNSLYAVPGEIDSINHDGTANITALIPVEAIVIDHAANERKTVWRLTERQWTAVIACDPCTVVARRAVVLNEPMMDRTTGAVAQTVTDQWVVAGKSRMPRVRDMYTSLIGRWFDPSRWHYRVYCWRGPYEDITHQTHPEVEQWFPKKRPVYENYAEAFQRFYKENLTKDGTWDRVEIRPVDIAATFVPDGDEVR